MLFSDSDFVASPCLSPDGTLLAFQTWSHPDMPWDETQIRVAGFDGLSLTGLRLIKQETPGSLVQPQFNARGDLYFIADWSNWWNLYRVSARALQADCRAEPLLPVAAEFCPPQWQIGQHHYDFFDDRHLLVSVNRECFWELALLDQKNGEMTPLQSGLGLLENVFCQAGGVFFVAATATADPALQRINLQLSGPVSGPEVLYKSRTLPLLEAEGISAPEHFSCTGTGGESAYGIFYPPCNPAYRAPADTLPPLLVNVHGGPTSSARASFNPAVQFWTSRGFAVLDVNHRGSSGYGRSFRHRLYGNWGEMDVEDVLAAVQHLLTTERVAAEKVAIRGSSAGGYAVLAALVQSDLFSAGTCCYGISDLALLAAQTHKFESRYVEQLIGPWPEAAALYRQRS
ncbi:MAG: prolyl oligopeptidase family serine peptidase, partial [Pseudohongiellaceae bacterium]